MSLSYLHPPDLRICFYQVMFIVQCGKVDFRWAEVTWYHGSIGVITNLVADVIVFVVARQPVERGEASHFEVGRHVVGRGVHLDDGHVLVFERLSHLLVDGHKLLTVTTPGSIELDQRVLVVVDDHFIEVLCHSRLKRPRIVWQRFGLDVRLQVTRFHVVQELFQVLDPVKSLTVKAMDRTKKKMGNSRESVLHDEFVALSVLDGDTRLFVVDEVEAEFGNFLLEVVLVADGETEVVSKRLGHLEDTVAPVVCALNVLHVVDGIVSDEKWLAELNSIICCPVADQTVVVGLDPSVKRLFGGRTVEHDRVGFELVTEMLGTEEDDAVGATQLFGHVARRRNAKTHRLPQFIGQLEEGFVQRPRRFREEAHNADLFTGQECLGHCNISQFFGAGTDLGLHVLDDASSLTWSIVLS